jgi:hypothetical protein
MCLNLSDDLAPTLYIIGEPIVLTCLYKHLCLVCMKRVKQVDGCLLLLHI